jgi:hypothetical protein
VARYGEWIDPHDAPGGDGSGRGLPSDRTETPAATPKTRGGRADPQRERQAGAHRAVRLPCERLDRAPQTRQRAFTARQDTRGEAPLGQTAIRQLADGDSWLLD